MIRQTLLALLFLSLFVIPTAAHRNLTRANLDLAPQTQDQTEKVTILLKDGRTIEGEISNINGETFEIHTIDGMQVINLDDIESFISNSQIPEEISKSLARNSKAVSMLLRTNASHPRIKQMMVIVLMVGGGSPVSHAQVTLKYNPEVLSLKTVRDGGLFKAGGKNPSMSLAQSNDSVTATLDRAEGMPDVKANGQLLVYVFEVTAAGDTKLRIDHDLVKMTKADGSAQPIRTFYGKLVVS